MDSIRTVWLAEDNWYGVLAFVLALLVVLAFAFVRRLYVRKRERTEWSELLRKNEVQQ